MHVAHVMKSNIKSGTHSVFLVLDCLLSVYYVQSTELKLAVFWSLFFLFTALHLGWMIELAELEFITFRYLADLIRLHFLLSIFFFYM